VYVYPKAMIAGSCDNIARSCDYKNRHRSCDSIIYAAVSCMW